MARTFVRLHAARDLNISDAAFRLYFTMVDKSFLTEDTLDARAWGMLRWAEEARISVSNARRIKKRFASLELVGLIRVFRVGERRIYHFAFPQEAIASKEELTHALQSA